MAVTSYYSEGEVNAPISNENVIEWLNEARQAGHTRIYVKEYTFIKRRIFRKPLVTRLYEVLNKLGVDSVEYQIINFCRDHDDWTINTMVPAEIAIAYLIGLSSSHRRNDRTHEND